MTGNNGRVQEFDAVVFDFDGVLADTDAGWARTEAAMRERYGLPYTPAVAEQTHGVGMLDSVRLLTADAPHPVDEDEALAAMRALAAEAVPAAARPFPGARAAVARIGEQLPVAIASNSERPMLELLVNRLGLDDLVDAVVSASDVAAAKPAPDVYARAVTLLGADPARTLVVEDSATGAAAARAAGCRVWRLVEAGSRAPHPDDGPAGVGTGDHTALLRRLGLAAEARQQDGADDTGHHGTHHLPEPDHRRTTR